MMRALLGFLVAPVVPAVAMYFYGLFFVPAGQVEFWPLMFGISAYLAAFALGLPAYLLLRRKGAQGIKSYLAAGALIGVTAYLLFIVVVTPTHLPMTSSHTQSLLQGSMGLAVSAIAYATVASLLFWLIAVRGKQ